MKYLSSEPFSVAPGNATSQKNWDRAFMTERAFRKKYGEDPKKDIVPVDEPGYDCGCDGCGFDCMCS